MHMLYTVNLTTCFYVSQMIQSVHPCAYCKKLLVSLSMKSMYISLCRRCWDASCLLGSLRSSPHRSKQPSQPPGRALGQMQPLDQRQTLLHRLPDPLGQALNPFQSQGQLPAHHRRHRLLDLQGLA